MPLPDADGIPQRTPAMLPNLIRRLQREIRQQPRKAAVLAVLLLLAVWRIAAACAPLLDSPATAAAVVPPRASTTERPDPPETIESGKRVERLINWKLAGAALQTHPLLQSAGPEAFLVDPFRIDGDQFSPPIAFVPTGEDAGLWESETRPQPPPATPNNAAEATDKPPPPDALRPPSTQLRPASEHPALAGLRVTAILVTPRRRLAAIGGRVYPVGATLRSSTTEAATTEGFRIAEIERDAVVVQATDGERYVLPLESRTGGVEIAPASHAATGRNDESTPPPHEPSATQSFPEPPP